MLSITEFNIAFEIGDFIAGETVQRTIIHQKCYTRVYSLKCFEQIHSYK